MEQLSDEMILHIAGFLNFRGVMSLSCVNRRFNKLSKDKSLCRVANFSKCLKLSDNLVLKSIENFKPSLKVVNLEDCHWLLSTTIQHSLRKCRNLVQISLLGCSVTIKGLNDILLHNPLIVNLSWSVPKGVNKDISDSSHDNYLLGEDLRSGFKKLKELTLTFEQDVDGTISCLFTEEMALLQLTVFFFLEFGPCLSKAKIKSSKGFTLLRSSIPGGYWPGHVKTLLNSAVLNASRTLGLSVLVMPLAIPCTINALHNQTAHLQTLELYGPSYLIAKEVNTLVYFNSSKSQSLSVNGLSDVCRANSNLKYLNLYGCHSCLGDDLKGLQSIASNCKNLRQLNIGKIHCCIRTNGNQLLRIIASIVTLESLAISDCMMAGTSSENLRKNRPSENPFMCNLNKRRVSRLTASKTEYTLPSTTCRLAVPSNQGCVFEDNHHAGRVEPRDETEIGCSPKEKQTTDVERLAQCTQCMEELEILKTDDCDWILSDEELLVLSQWKKLRKLTIYGVKLFGKVDFLLSVAKNCPVLEFLSLNKIDKRFSGGYRYMSYLIKALPFLINLKVFRLEQPHFNITRSFLASMYQCKRLHSLCIIANGGRIENGVNFSELFNMCQDLTVLFMACESPVARMKRIQDDLIERFRPSRPALWVTMCSPHHLTQVDALAKVPYRIKDDLVYFRSRVACSDVT